MIRICSVFIVVTIIVLSDAKLSSPDIFLSGGLELIIRFKGSKEVSRVVVHIKGDKTYKVYNLEQEQDATTWNYKDRHSQIKLGETIHYQIVVCKRGYPMESMSDTVILSSKTSMAPSCSIRSVTVFRDDFNHFDKSHYRIEVDATRGGNGEFQIYTPEHQNLYTANGYLYIKPTLTIDHPAFDNSRLYNGQLDVKSLWGTCTRSFKSGCHKSAHGQEILPPIMSGKVYTNAVIKYGRINVRARLPKGDWLWPVIWLTSRDHVYGTWPRSGEIDVMEARGNAKAMSNGVNHGITQITSALHYGLDRAHKRSIHNEGCLVDNHEILRVNTPSQSFWEAGHFPGTNIWGDNKNAPFDQPFRVLLNVAVGVLGFFPDHFQCDTPKPWCNDSPHPKRDFWEKKDVWLPTWQGNNVVMLIDYIKMIQY